MPKKDYFPMRPDINPTIYAYEDTNPQYEGLLKVGFTRRTSDIRVKEQYNIKRPSYIVPYRIVLSESAMYPDGTHYFIDDPVHDALERRNIENVDGEWYRCTVGDVKAAIIEVREGRKNTENRTQSFKMRPEQQAAVDKTAAYYRSLNADDPTRTPKFLWNAKMRFGKTFAAYQLAKKMGFTRVLVLTFKPAVQTAWREDLLTHIDFEGWQFIGRDNINPQNSIDLQYQNADKDRPIVCFGSFQDFLGVNRETGGIKSKNEWVHETNWDLVIFDEYHFGAWRENAKKLFEEADEDAFDSENLEKYDRGNACDETFLPITTEYYLYLSGTPFRALNSGEFIEEQIFNWTYSDEQRAKAKWQEPDNPYAALPRMVLLTYKIPDSIQRIAKQGEFDEFDLNLFFKAEGKEENAQFVYKDYVQKWLDLIRGSFLESSVDDLKLGAQKPPMPYSDTRLLNVLSHTLWFLPDVASCYAMANLLAERQNTFYHDYKINVCAGAKAGIGAKAVEPVLKSMRDPLQSKTITLSCGKLTTGVTVKPWAGIFMLRNLSSPETYFQAAFRVQSPWVITDDSGKDKEIMKKECYVFDFALTRALKQISDYSRSLNIAESNPEQCVAEFINFLPVLAYDGSAMRQVNAAEILDIAMAGTSATLLAKRWESALLVNVDNETLARLLANEEVMNALMNIEGFRSLNTEIQTIINKSESVKKAKRENKTLTPKEKEQLNAEEKEYKSKRKMIQEKLIKFATRIPVFMYLTDFREYSLKDVITKLEPRLFKKVTGLNVKDFELLVSLNVFNEALMNDAVYKFRRYEDASLSYTGINKHAGEKVGLYNTAITEEEYKILGGQLVESMQAPAITAADIAEATYLDNIEDDRDNSSNDSETEVIQDNDSYGINASNDRQTNTANISMPTGNGTVNTTPPQSTAAQNILQSKTMASAAPAFTANPYNIYVPPKPTVLRSAPKIDIDLSDIVPGAAVIHKGLGKGTVLKIEGTRIWISFDGFEKIFPFTATFYQGFLHKNK